jgi:tetratricopeptide (TPR) repeat protein
MRYLLLFLFFLVANICSAQTSKIDSLLKVLPTIIADSTKVRCYNTLSANYESKRLDSAILYMQMSLSVSKKINETDDIDKFEAYALTQLAYLYGLNSNYPKALEYNIEALKLAEKQIAKSAKEPIKKKAAYSDFTAANTNIAYIYQKENNYDLAFKHLKIADSIIDNNNLTNLKDASLGNLGYHYFKIDKLDSALYLSMKAYEISKQKADKRLIGIWLTNIGNIYAKMGNTDAAFSNYKEAMANSNAAADYDAVCESSLGLAKLYEKNGNTTAAMQYANSILSIANTKEYNGRRLEVFEYFTNHYQQLKKYDSAFIYQAKMVALKDTINSNERIKDLLNMTIDEDLRQLEKQELIKKQVAQRKKTLQLLGLGLCMPSLFLLTIYLRRQKIKPNVIKFCGIASLLMFFECLTLFIHPWVVKISHHIIVLELLIFVCIAAVVIPVHHRLEHWLIDKLTHKKTANHIQVG